MDSNNYHKILFIQIMSYRENERMGNPYEGSRYDKYNKLKQELERQNYLLMQQRQNISGKGQQISNVPSQYTIIQRNYNQQEQSQQSNSEEQSNHEQLPSFESKIKNTTKATKKNVRYNVNQKSRVSPIGDDIIQMISQIQRKAFTQIQSLRNDKILLMKKLNEQIRAHNAEKKRCAKLQAKLSSQVRKTKVSSNRQQSAKFPRTIYQEEQQQNSPAVGPSYQQRSNQKPSNTHYNIHEVKNYEIQNSRMNRSHAQIEQSPYNRQQNQANTQSHQQIAQQVHPHYSPQHPHTTQNERSKLSYQSIPQPQSHPQLQPPHPRQTHQLAHQQSSPILQYHQNNPNQYSQQSVLRRDVEEGGRGQAQSVYYPDRKTKMVSVNRQAQVENQIQRLRNQNMYIRSTLPRNNSNNSLLLKNNLRQELKQLEAKAQYYEQLITNTKLNNPTSTMANDGQIESLLYQGAAIAEDGKKLMKVRSNPQFRPAEQITNASRINNQYRNMNNNNSIVRTIQKSRYEQQGGFNPYTSESKKGYHNNFPSSSYETIIQNMNRAIQS